MKKIYCLLILSFFAFEGISQTVSKKKLEVLGQSQNNQRIKSPNSFSSQVPTAVNDTTNASQDDGKKMTFQGSLYREGVPFNGTATLGFAINLDSATTWSESIADVTVINGLYSVVLGETSGIPSNLFDNANERTLSVTVDGETLGNVKLYAPFGAGGGAGSMIKDANGNVVGIFEADALGNGTLDISGTNQGSGEIQSFVKLNVISDSLNGESFQYGNMEFNNSIGTSNVLSTDGMRRYNEFGNQLAQFTANGAGFNHTFPDGSTSPTYDYRRAGFMQMVAYDSTQNLGSYSQMSFGGNGSNPYIFMSDFNARTDIGVFEGQGYLNLTGSTTDNIWMGGKVFDDTPELPYFQMIGEAQVQGDILPDSLGNPTDTTYYNPMLVWMDVQRWENGTELGHLTLRSTDGNEVNISPYGIEGLSNTQSKEHKLEAEFSNDIIGNWKSYGDGGQINLKGKIDTIVGGGVSLGTKFYSWMEANHNQLGYFHLRGSVVPDGNYFNSNMRFSMEAVDRGETEEAEFKMYGSQIEDGEALFAKTVLNMNSVRDGQGQSAAEILSDGSSSPNFALGAKYWEDNGANRPYFRMNGSEAVNFLNDNGTPDSVADDFEDFYHPDLIWMDVAKWDDGTEIGGITFRGTDGSEFSINSQGVDGGNLMQVGKGEEGTYTQQQKTAFRVKNDNDQFSAVHLSRFNDGQTRLQLTNHDSTGVAQATTFLGTNSNGGYLFMNSAKVDGSGNATMVDLYTTGNSPSGDLMDNGYKRSGVDFYDNDGSRLSALGSAKDTGGKSGLMFLWGEDDVPNVEITGKRWENASLPTVQLFGTTSDGNGWYSPNAVFEVNEDGGSQYGQLSLNKSNPNDSTSSGSTILLNGNSGNANFSGTATASELKAGDYFGNNVGLYLNGNDGSMVASGDINSDANINAVDGNFSGVLTSADGTVQSSDRRLKKGIASLDNALENTLKMRGVSYTWKDESKSQKNQIGVIAQEVEKVYPEFVVTKSDGMKAVNYAQMVAVLIEAVKELNSEIATLKAENSDLKAQAIKTAELSKRLDMIEKLLMQGEESSTSIESE